MMKNKKGQTSTWGTVIAIVITLLLLLIAWQLYQRSDQGIEDIGVIADKWLQNIGAGVEGDNPCPCSDDNTRVQIDGTVYCRANLEAAPCENQFGFKYDRDQDACYYTRTQCIQFLASRT
ncbi:MAG: hypothetical protein ACMXX9_01905 [Candidatus Woesearchaeota archaeon]